jgi:hypothetical protein
MDALAILLTAVGLWGGLMLSARMLERLMGDDGTTRYGVALPTWVRHSILAGGVCVVVAALDLIIMSRDAATLAEGAALGALLGVMSIPAGAVLRGDPPGRTVARMALFMVCVMAAGGTLAVVRI